MKQKLDLSVLKYANLETVDKISQNTASAPSRNMERIFTASEQKYQYHCFSTEQYAVSETYQTEPIQRSSIFFQTAATAACLLVCTGTVGGGIYLLNQGRTMQEISTAELTETEASEPETTANQPVLKTTETILETTDFQVKPKTSVETAKAETQPVITSETEFVSETTALTETEMTESSTQTETTTEQTETFEPEQTLPVQEEPESISLTPLAIEEENNHTMITVGEYFGEAKEVPLYQDISFIQPWTDTVFPGFYYGVKQFKFAGDETYTTRNWLRAVEDENTPQTIQTVYAPAYIPEGYEQTLETRLENMLNTTEEKNPDEAFGYYCTAYLNPKNTASGHMVFFTQYAKNIWGYCTEVLSSPPSDAITNAGMISPEKAVILNGHYGLNFSAGKYSLEDSDREEYDYIWDNGDYIFELSTSDISFEEFLKIAASIQPIE